MPRNSQGTFWRSAEDGRSDTEVPPSASPFFLSNWREMHLSNCWPKPLDLLTSWPHIPNHPVAGIRTYKCPKRKLAGHCSD